LSRHSELLRIRTLPNSTWDTTAQMRTARSAATKRHVIELGVSPKQKERARHGSGGQHLQDDLSGSTSRYGGASLAEGRLHETKEAANRGGLTRPGPSPTRALYDGPFRVDGARVSRHRPESQSLGSRVVPVRPPTEAALLHPPTKRVCVTGNTKPIPVTARKVQKYRMRYMPNQPGRAAMVQEVGELSAHLVV